MKGRKLGSGGARDFGGRHQCEDHARRAQHLPWREHAEGHIWVQIYVLYCRIKNFEKRAFLERVMPRRRQN